jgi:hypothetical protein
VPSEVVRTSARFGIRDDIPQKIRIAVLEGVAKHYPVPEDASDLARLNVQTYQFLLYINNPNFDRGIIRNMVRFITNAIKDENAILDKNIIFGDHKVIEERDKFYSSMSEDEASEFLRSQGQLDRETSRMILEKLIAYFDKKEDIPLKADILPYIDDAAEVFRGEDLYRDWQEKLMEMLLNTEPEMEPLREASGKALVDSADPERRFYANLYLGRDLPLAESLEERTENIELLKQALASGDRDMTLSALKAASKYHNFPVDELAKAIFIREYPESTDAAEEVTARLYEFKDVEIRNRALAVLKELAGHESVSAAIVDAFISLIQRNPGDKGLRDLLTGYLLEIGSDKAIIYAYLLRDEGELDAYLNRFAGEYLYLKDVRLYPKAGDRAKVSVFDRWQSIRIDRESAVNILDEAYSDSANGLRARLNAAGALSHAATDEIPEKMPEEIEAIVAAKIDSIDRDMSRLEAREGESLSDGEVGKALEDIRSLKEDLRILEEGMNILSNIYDAGIPAEYSQKTAEALSRKFEQVFNTDRVLRSRELTGPAGTTEEMALTLLRVSENITPETRDAVYAVLGQVLADPFSARKLRSKAAEVLASKGSEEEKVLARLLRAEVNKVAGMGKKVLPRLVWHLQNSADGEVRKNAAYAIAAIGAPEEGESRNALKYYLQEAFSREEDASIRRIIVKALAVTIPGEDRVEDIRIIRKMISSESDEEVMAELIKEADRLPAVDNAVSGAKLEFFEEVFSNDRYPRSVKSAAANAMQRLGSEDLGEADEGTIVRKMLSTLYLGRIDARLPYNGPYSYIRSEQPMPLNNIKPYLGMLGYRAQRVQTYMKQDLSLSDVPETMGPEERSAAVARAVDRAEEKETRDREYRTRKMAEITKGKEGGVNAQRSSMIYGMLRNLGGMIQVGLAGIAVGFVLYYLRRVLEYHGGFAGINIGVLGSYLTPTIFIGSIIVPAYVSFMAGIQIEKVLLYANRFKKNPESITLEELAGTLPPELMADFINRIRKRIPDEELPVYMQKNVTTRNIAKVVKKMIPEQQENVFFNLPVIRALFKDKKPTGWPYYNMLLNDPVLETYYLSIKKERNKILEVIKNDKRLSASVPELEELTAKKDTYNNEDILKYFSVEDIRYMVEKYGDKLFPRIALMETTFGGSAGGKLVTIVESAVQNYPGTVDVFPVTDDDDRGGFTAMNKAIYGNPEGVDRGRPEPDKSDPNKGRLYDYRNQINVVLCPERGMNLDRIQRKVRMKPPLNAEEVQVMKKFYAQQGLDLPRFVELVDEEDRLTPLVLPMKLCVWETRENIIRQQTALKQDTAGGRRWNISYKRDRTRLENEYNKVLESLFDNSGLERNAENTEKLVSVPAAEAKNWIGEKAGAEDRVRYILWAFLKVYPTIEDFVSSEFRIRNIATVMQTELRQVPIAHLTEDWSDMAWVDYMVWHNSIQIGQTKLGFLFLGGTGNGFLWEMLACTRLLMDGDRILEEIPLHPRVELQQLLNPLRETIAAEETEREYDLSKGIPDRSVNFLVGMVSGIVLFRLINAALVSGAVSVWSGAGMVLTAWFSVKFLKDILARYVPLTFKRISQLAGSFAGKGREGLRKTLLPSSLLRKHITVYSPSGVWDPYNQIEDAELGSRIALFKLKNTRLEGKFVQILEDELPPLGPKWWLQRSRWITLQTFWVIVGYKPSLYMFLGQYLGFGLGWALIGSTKTILGGAVAGLVGFAAGTVAGYYLGNLVFEVFRRMGLTPGEQWHVDPIKGMGYEGKGPVKGFLGRFKGWRVYQHMAHLSAATLAGIATLVAVSIAILYCPGQLLTLLDNSFDMTWAGTLGGFIMQKAGEFKITIEYWFGWLPDIGSGIFMMLLPPVLLVLMAWGVLARYAGQDEESTNEALRVRISGQVSVLEGIKDLMKDTREGSDLTILPSLTRHVDLSDDEKVLYTLDMYKRLISYDRETGRYLDSVPGLFEKMLLGRDGTREDDRGVGSLRNSSGELVIDMMQREVDKIYNRVKNELRKRKEEAPIAPEALDRKEIIKDIIKEVNDIESGIRGEFGVNVSWMISFSAVFSVVFISWVNLFIPSVIALPVLVVSMTMPLAWVVNKVSRVIFRKPVFSFGRLPFHMLSYMSRTTARGLDYFTHMLIASFLNIGRNMLFGYTSEAYWTRGREDAAKPLLGVPLRSPRQKHYWFWQYGMKRIIPCLLLLVFPIMGILSLIGIDKSTVFRKSKVVNAVVERPLEKFVEAADHSRADNSLADEGYKEFIWDLLGNIEVEILRWLGPKIDYYYETTKSEDKREAIKFYISAKTVLEIERMTDIIERLEAENASEYQIQRMKRRRSAFKENVNLLIGQNKLVDMIKRLRSGDSFSLAGVDLSEWDFSAELDRERKELYEAPSLDMPLSTTPGYMEARGLDEVIDIIYPSSPFSETRSQITEKGWSINSTFTRDTSSGAVFLDLGDLAGSHIYEVSENARDVNYKEGIYKDHFRELEYTFYLEIPQEFVDAGVKIRPVLQSFNERTGYRATRAGEARGVRGTGVTIRVNPTEWRKYADVTVGEFFQDSVIGIGFQLEFDPVDLGFGDISGDVRVKDVRIKHAAPTAVSKPAPRSLLFGKAAEEIRPAKERIEKAEAKRAAMRRGFTASVRSRGRHAFRALSGISGALIAGTGFILSAVVSPVVKGLAAGASGQEIISSLTLPGTIVTLAVAYFAAAVLSHIFIGGRVYKALRDHYLDNPDETAFPDTGGMPRRTELMSMSIADSGGWRHPAFYRMSDRMQAIINAHESFKNHFIGMIMMSPVLRLAARKESRADKITIGIPQRVYGSLSAADKATLDSMADVNIAVLKSRDEQSMLIELESARRRTEAVASALVDINTGDKDIPSTVMDFVSKVRRSIFDLTNPELRRIDEKTISRIENLPRVLSRISEDMRWSGTIKSLELSSLSVYQMRMNRSYNAYYAEPARESGRVRYFKNLMESRKEHYLIHFAEGDALLAEGALSLVPAGLEITRRRQIMGVDKETDRQHDKFIIAAPIGIKTDEQKAIFKEKLMEAWMLNGVIDPSDMKIVDNRSRKAIEEFRTDELMRIAQRMSPGTDADDIDEYYKIAGVRIMAGEATYTDDNLIQLELSPKATSNVNQYEVFVNLVVSGRDDDVLPAVEGLYRSRGRCFIYLPEIEAINFQDEIENYNRYVREVLIKA